MIKKICSSVSDIFKFVVNIFINNFQKNIVIPAAALTAGFFSFFTFVSTLFSFKFLSQYNHINISNNVLMGAIAIISLALLITFSIIYFQLRKSGNSSKNLAIAAAVESVFLFYFMFVYFHNSDVLILACILICINSCIFNLQRLFSISITLICLCDIFLLLFSGIHLPLIFNNFYNLTQSISFTNMNSSPISFVLLFWLFSFIQRVIPSAYVKKQEKLADLDFYKKQIVSANQEKEELVNKQNSNEAKIKNIQSAITDITSIISNISDNFITKDLTTDEAVKVTDTYLEKINCYFKNNDLKVSGNGSILLSKFFRRLEIFLSTNNVSIATEIEKADSKLKFALQGQKGEDLIKQNLMTYNDLIYLNSINLPYDYKNASETNDNQIDGIVINNRGIFILEIKNYFPFRKGDQLTTFKINHSGHIEAIQGSEIKTYDKNNSIRRQMDLHKAALSTIFQKNNKLKYLNVIHTVCVISRTDNIITDGKDIIDVNNLYSEFLNNSNFKVCLTNDDIKEIKNILLKNNLEERTYSYTILKDISNELLNILYSDDNWYCTSSTELVKEKEKLSQENNDLIIKISKITDQIANLEGQKSKIEKTIN